MTKGVQIMDNENVKVVSDALTGSLESTQKTATDTEKLVQQVQAMSGKMYTRRP